MEVPVLKAWRRSDSGKGVARKIRAKGLIPAVFYGGGEHIPLTLSAPELMKILSAGENTILQLDLDGQVGEDRKAIVRAMQWHPVKDVLLHVDLFRISMDVELIVSVPIVLQGISREVSDAGGVINQLLHEISIQCLPSLIPHELMVDVSHLGINEVLHVRDVRVPQGVQVLAEGDDVVASVTVRGEEEVAVEAEAVEGEEEAEAPAPEAESEEA